MSWRLSGSDWPGARRGGYQPGSCFSKAAGAVYGPGVVVPLSRSGCSARSCPRWILAAHDPVFTGGKKPHPDRLGGREGRKGLTCPSCVLCSLQELWGHWPSSLDQKTLLPLAVSPIIQNLMSYVKTQMVVGE